MLPGAMYVIAKVVKCYVINVTLVIYYAVIMSYELFTCIFLSCEKTTCTTCVCT